MTATFRALDAAAAWPELARECPVCLRPFTILRHWRQVCCSARCTWRLRDRRERAAVALAAYWREQAAA